MKTKQKVMRNKSLSASPMKAKELCYIAVMAAIESVVFTSFSFVLYLECITFTIVLFAMCFETKQAVLGAIVFSIVNLSMQGVTPWSMMYCLIYPLYSLFIGISKPFLQKHFWLLCFLCGCLSFLTGQLVQIPFLLISKKITILYILAGLKISCIQGCLSAFCCMICYQPIYTILKKITRSTSYGKIM